MRPQIFIAHNRFEHFHRARVFIAETHEISAFCYILNLSRSNKAFVFLIHAERDFLRRISFIRQCRNKRRYSICHLAVIFFIYGNARNQIVLIEYHRHDFRKNRLHFGKFIVEIIQEFLDEIVEFQIAVVIIPFFRCKISHEFIQNKLMTGTQNGHLEITAALQRQFLYALFRSERTVKDDFLQKFHELRHFIHKHFRFEHHFRHVRINVAFSVVRRHAKTHTARMQIYCIGQCFIRIIFCCRPADKFFQQEQIINIFICNRRNIEEHFYISNAVRFHIVF